MMLKTLREEVLEANLEIVRRGLVLYTFGNASGLDRDSGVVAIKPSGVPYEKMKPAHLVLVDLDGKIVEGKLKPSSDVDTHLVLYRAFPSIGGIVHSHSRFAVTWAQAGRDIPCLGTTHGDYFHGAIPVTKALSPREIKGKYEENTGHAIVRRFAKLDAAEIPGVIVRNHGPFAWGRNATEAALHGVILEEVATTAWQTCLLQPDVKPAPQALMDEHFYRKHGPNASYGQEKK